MGQTEAMVQFTVHEGGKLDEPITKTAPKGPEVLDWLRGLGRDVKFLCRGKNHRGCFLDNYGVAQVEDFAVLLYNFLPSYGASPYLWVDSFKFSQDHVLVGIIPPQEEGNNNEHAEHDKHHLPPTEPREEHDGHEGPA